MMLLRGRASQSLETAAAWPPTSSQILERKDGTALRPEIAPGTRVDAVRQRQGTRQTRHSVSFVERLFESESHPVVGFVVQGTDRHKTFMLRTPCHGLNLLRIRTSGPRPSSACYRPTLRCFPSEADGPRGAALPRAPRGPPLTFGSFRM
jgi:hypothetical protein